MMTETRPRVLVVDDEALIRMNTSDMLDEIGFSSLEAGSADDAFALLGEHPEIGIMIADLQMPGTSGEELVRRARKLHPELKIIVATGHAPEPFAGRAEFAGVSFLAKPFAIAELRSALKAAR